MRASTRLLSSTTLIAIAACTTAPNPSGAGPSEPSTGRILTSFDQVTLGRGDRTRFRASLVEPGDRLVATGLALSVLDPKVARVRGGGGRVEVEGLASGHTWILLRGGDAADSVEVVVR